jgi:serine hydrolase
MRTTILIIPGLHNSGSDHWQSHFERELDGCTRVEQSDWTSPVCSDWINVLDTAIQHHGDRVVLAAHSLGCATVAHCTTDTVMNPIAKGTSPMNSQDMIIG